MTQFTDLGLSAGLLAALRTQGYETPTPIQAQAIPPIMQGRDLLGVAQTGTGKTAAFALPILHRLSANRRPASRKACRVLVLSPTRELAQQIAESFRTYGAKSGVTVAVFVGGVKYGAQVKSVAAGVDVLVATPGRLIDHMGQGVIRLDETEVFVLDEADQMLDLGFLEPIRKIVRKLPHKRQNLFFSATMPAAIATLAGEILHDAAEVRVTPESTTVERVSQRVIHVEADRKRDILVDLIAPRSVSRVLIFTRTKHGADRLAKFVAAAGIDVAAIHGDKSQAQRERALAAFKSGHVRALIATDIAARGIDVDSVSHVINFELPNVPESYVHRIGRTARAGNEGAAITLCDRTELKLLRDIERVTRMSIPAEDMRADQRAPLTPVKAPAPGGGANKPRRRGSRPGWTPKPAAQAAVRKANDGPNHRRQGQRPSRPSL
ncbi:MAG TPA: DEAD/DEAH box helicase [Caulobacteraceae bacterium]|nr:DEAD/DEAH box helicase [Caulobacteraceae bacterium]